MKLEESLKLSFTSLINNKLRTSLTLLGIIVGIFSIILIMTIITMLQSTIESGVSMLGKNTFQIQKFPAIRMGGPGSGRKYWDRKDITIEDFYRLKDMLSTAKYVAAEQYRNGRIIKYKNKQTNPNVSLVGITTDAFHTNDWYIDQGRALLNLDIERSSNFVVLGREVVNFLFDKEDPVGKEVKIDNRPFLVVGVLEKKGELFGQSRDNIVIIPMTTYQSMYGRYGRSINITVTSYSKYDYNDVIDAATGYMRTIRKNLPGQENDFEVFSNESLLGEINNITKYVELGAMAVSFIALLAAGVGIMNIMLVSVTERTKEIGIRKAVGAKRSDILIQFMTEAITLCVFGGLVGIVLGVVLGNFAGSFLAANALIPYNWIMIGIFICVIVGVIFGTYPAYKAANLDPIEALRYE